MKRILLFLATMMYVMVAGAADKGCIDLGRDPFGNRDAMPALVALVGAEEAKVFADLMATTPGEQITSTPDMKFDMEFGNYKLMKNMCVRGSEPATAFVNPKTGKVLMFFWKCLNPGLLLSHRAEVVTQVAPPVPAAPATSAVTPSVAVAPAPADASPASVSAFDPPRRIEVEVGAGIGVWSNTLAKGDWAYAEALLWKEVGGGKSVGAGFYGNYGSGNSKLSDYSWKEHALGVQVGVKGSYKNDEGQPANWQAKLRLLAEREHGGSPTSGYAMAQQNLKAGFYLENMKRVDAECIEGWNVEGWKSFDASMKSTWAGDKPQNRDQAQANYVRECRIDKLWSWRVTAGPAWTSWDNQFWANIGVELKYDLANNIVLRFGPSVGIPLGVSKTYAGHSIADLTTLRFGVRLEFGDYLRTEDAKRRVAEITPATQGVVTAKAVPAAQVAPVAVPATQAVSKGSDPCFTCDNRPGSWHTLE